ncbi:hypothetical protein ACLBW0_13485 [Enterobacteriaceae bacterium C34A]
MKLPRYLQAALAATAVAVIWSQFVDDAPLPEASLLAPKNTLPSAKSEAEPLSRPVPGRADLFAFAPSDKASEPTDATPHEETQPPTPELPLQILGAWWRHHQRTLLLTDGTETWPVCRDCRAEGKIWIGSEPVNGWILKAVAKDHLLFEWRLTHAERRLELGDLQSEPTR